MSEFKIGDRVVLVDDGGWFNDYRKWAKQKRPAVVEAVDDHGCVIRFQTKRKVRYPGDYVMHAAHTDLAPAPTTTET